jgi:hypothetical protein
MAAAIFLLALFVSSERHSEHPVITPSLFRKRSFVVGLMVVAGFYASLSAFVLVINLLLQLGMHWTPLHTGLTLIPWALGTAVAVLLAGAVLAEKLGRTSLHLGLSIAVIGLLALWWSIAHWGTGITVWKLAPALLVTGFGAGLVFVPLVDFILGDATTEEVGTGVGMLNAIQQFAGAIGVAALGTVFFRPGWAPVRPLLLRRRRTGLRHRCGPVLPDAAAGGPAAQARPAAARLRPAPGGGHSPAGSPASTCPAGEEGALAPSE